MMEKIFIVAIGFSFFISISIAQVKVRKTFEGTSSDESKPASLLFNRDFASKTTFFTMDAGVKISDFSIGESNLIVAPKIEYHVDKRDTFKINTFGFGGNLEWIADGKPLWVAGSVDYTSDQVKKQEFIKLKGNTSLFFTKCGLPGSTIRHRKLQASLFRYTIAGGFEYIKSVKNEKEGEATFFPLRLYFDFWPLPDRSDISKQYLLMTFEYTYRYLITGKLYGAGDKEWITTGLTFFPEGNSLWGIGLDYSNGYDASSNFAKIDRVVFSLKFKI